MFCTEIVPTIYYICTGGQCYCFIGNSSLLSVNSKKRGVTMICVKLVYQWPALTSANQRYVFEILVDGQRQLANGFMRQFEALAIANFQVRQCRIATSAGWRQPALSSDNQLWMAIAIAFSLSQKDRFYYLGTDHIIFVIILSFYIVNSLSKTHLISIRQIN